MEGGINWEMLMAVLVQACLIAIFQERALALVFEHKYLQGKLSGMKELIALGVSFYICKTWSIDIISSIRGDTDVHRLGTFLSAMAIAGGSKLPMMIIQAWQVRVAARNGGASVPPNG